MADIGKILILPRGTYSSSATYNILDVVRYNGKVWCCKDNNVSGVAPSESAYWTLWVQDGNSGTGTGDMTKAVYDTDDDGIVDSAETLNGLTSTIAQLNYLNSTTGNVQTQLDDRIVDPVTKSNGQVLTYDSTALKWKAETPSTGATNLNGLSDVTITSATSGQMLKYTGSVWENTAMPTVDQTYNSASTNAQSGTAVASAISGKANTSQLDEWSSEATAQTVGSDVVVVFDNLYDNYGYDPYAKDELISIKSMTKGTGTTTGTIKLTYVLDGATSGVTKCKLRILK